MARTREFNPDDVLDKAMRLFWEKGYEATSMAELEKVLCINKFSIYNTFGNKHALFLAALNRYADRMSGHLIKALTQDVDGLNSIRRFFDVIEQNILSQPKPIGCFMVNSGMERGACDAEIMNKVQSVNRKVEDALYHCLADAQKKGEISKDSNLQEFARFLVTLYQGMIAVAKGEQDVRTVQSSIRFVKYLLDKC